MKHQPEDLNFDFVRIAISISFFVDSRAFLSTEAGRQRYESAHLCMQVVSAGIMNKFFSDRASVPNIC